MAPVLALAIIKARCSAIAANTGSGWPAGRLRSAVEAAGSEGPARAVAAMGEAVASVAAVADRAVRRVILDMLVLLLVMAPTGRAAERNSGMDWIGSCAPPVGAWGQVPGGSCKLSSGALSVCVFAAKVKS